MSKARSKAENVYDIYLLSYEYRSINGCLVGGLQRVKASCLSCAFSSLVRDIVMNKNFGCGVNIKHVGYQLLHRDGRLFDVFFKGV